MNNSAPSAVPPFLSGGGEIAALIAKLDWSHTSLGPIAEWPQSLKTAVAIMLRSAVPMVMLWGEDGVMIYNDAYSVFAAQRHPALLGSKVLEGWPEVADFNREVMRVGLGGGTLQFKDQELVLYRHGYAEQVWMNLDYSPVLDESGEPAGVLAIVVETTERILAEQGQQQAEASTQSSEARLRRVLDNMGEGFVLLDSDFRVVEVNRVGLALDTRSREEIVGRSCWDAWPSISQGPIRELYEKAMVGDRQISLDHLYVRPGGDTWIDTRAFPTGDGLAVFYKDITNRRRAQLELQQAHDTLAALNRIGQSVAAELDLQRVVQMVTDAGVELTGAQFGAFFYNVLDDTGESYMLYTLSGAERAQFDGFGMPRATAVFRPTFDGEGVIRSDDITADPRYGHNAPNRGMPTGHLPVRSYLAVPVTSRSGEVIGGLFFGHPEPARFELRHEQLMVGLAAQAAVAMDNARLYQAAQQEIAQRRAAEQALATLNETLEERVAQRTADRDRMWRLSTDVMLVASFEGRIEAVNPAWNTILGWGKDELIGHSFLDYVHPDDLERTLAEVASLADGNTTLRFENRYRRKDGSHAWLSWTAVPEDGLIHAVGRHVDAEKAAAAELERAQEALRQSQKMEAVGQLTGGVAHDFNNLLTVVTGNIDMAGRALAAAGVTDARARRSLDSAMRGAERAASLTQRLLAFSRRQPLAPKPLDLDKLVVGMSDLLNRALGETIRLEIVTSPGLWRVEIDPNQMESAILNLAVNARDAMPDGGTLIVETANARLDHEYAAAHAEVAPGHYVVICVTDTGTGIPRHVQDKVFEPFFTTKEVGRGTGLGLSMVYGFVKQSGGHVKLYSEDGQGTTVKIYLPRLMTDALPEEEATADSALEISRQSETILVVEDDDDVRAYTVECLGELGYRVLEAHDGPTALRLLDRQETPPDLLFTDVVMPGMSGRELADKARERDPGLRVLYTSGYTRNAIVHGGRLDTGVEMIAKPFTYQALAQKIRDVLDAGRTGRVLVVEAEPTVRALTVEALQAAGYVAEEAGDVSEALGKVRSAQGRYDVVFCDADLPDRPGEALVAELRAMHEALPILLSADPDQQAALVQRFAGDRCTGVIAKPYTAAVMTEALRTIGVRCAFG